VESPFISHLNIRHCSIEIIDLDANVMNPAWKRQQLFEREKIIIADAYYSLLCFYRDAPGTTILKGRGFLPSFFLPIYIVPLDRYKGF